MFKMLALLTLVVSLNVVATENPKHMVIFGNNFSAGWSGSSSSADVDSSLGIDELNIGNGNFKLNYAYTVAPKFQIGIDLDSELDTSETKANAGGKIKSEESASSILLFGIFNFSENLNDSFYLGAGFGKGWFKDETKDSTGGSTTSVESEYDADILFATFGKRFNLKFMGIENLTYSPSILLSKQTIGGDLEDAGVNSITTFQLDIIKFDLLF